MATAAAASKPTILLEHGAWHQPAHLAPFRARLHTAGYPTACPALPSTGKPIGALATDAAAIGAELARLVDAEGRDVLLLGHSYGGSVAAEAARAARHQSTRRKDGRPGGLVGLVFVNAAVPSEALPALNPHAQWPDYMVPTPDGGAGVRDPAAVFYNDVRDEEQVRRAVALVAPTHPRNTFTEPASHFDYRELPCAYVHCTKDAAIALEFQRAYVAAAGVPMRTVTLETGHTPFYSAPEAVLEVVESMAA